MYITQRNRVILITKIMGAGLNSGEKGVEQLQFYKDILEKL
jgi:hypothetical protein